MNLKDNLLRRGYLPEDLSPAFTTAQVAEHFLANPPRGYLMKGGSSLRTATYNASKRGLTRRIFSAIHPVTAYDMAKFVTDRWQDLTSFYGQSNLSYSVPEHGPANRRALVIKPHWALESAKYEHLSPYRFVACTDIARFYHSIYTHAIPWAFHGKEIAKVNRHSTSKVAFFNRADALIRNGQDGQSVGIPVGPDASRVFAEVIGTAIDLEFQNRIGGVNCKVVRHVDDVWIGTNTHAEAETALTRYREAIRKFQLDINENKTRIVSEDFEYCDSWPSEISSRIKFAQDIGGTRGKQHLRSALEHSFALAVQKNDDGILKYVLRYVDRNGLNKDHWDVVEPFLKRLAVHFGHTIDLIVRIVVWRHLAMEDFEIETWRSILGTILDKHGRLGNDSEVCWTIYANTLLRIEIDIETAEHIVKNCGALSIVALLVAAELGLVDASVYSTALDRLDGETDDGPFWPVFLEWKVRQWPEHRRIVLSNSTIEDLVDNAVSIYNPDHRPVVFDDVDDADLGDVPAAIEEGSSVYSDGVEEKDEGEKGEGDEGEGDERDYPF